MNNEHQLKSKLAWSVFQEYDIKTKMVQEQWLQLKMTLLFFYWVESTFGEREEKFGGERVNEQIFAWWGDSPIPLVGKTLYRLCQKVFINNEEAPCTLQTSCAKVAILLLQDLSTLCVTDIYGIYFHFSVQCL